MINLVAGTHLLYSITWAILHIIMCIYLSYRSREMYTTVRMYNQKPFILFLVKYICNLSMQSFIHTNAQYAFSKGNCEGEEGRESEGSLRHLNTCTNLDHILLWLSVARLVLIVVAWWRRSLCNNSAVRGLITPVVQMTDHMLSRCTLHWICASKWDQTSGQHEQVQTV